MMHKFPGVYSQINDQSQILTDYYTTSLGCVGESQYGVIDQPVLYTSAAEWINLFGAADSKYGMAPFFCTSISTAIPNSYFVRVVNKGNPEDEDRSNNAKWGSSACMVRGYTGEALESAGYYYEEIKSFEEARDNGIDSGLFSPTDLNTAFVIAAISPDNRKLYYTVTDTTNTSLNRGYAISNITVVPSNESGSGEESTLVKLVTSKDIMEDIYDGCSIVVKRMSNSDMNGTFKLTNYVENEDNVELTYIINKEINNVVANHNENVAIYPSVENTTFALSIFEKTGKVYQAVETYNECTLFNHKDGYGNSTYLEDVINGTSNYIQVFVNENFAKNDILEQPEVSENYIPLEGGSAGKFTNQEEKFVAIANAFEAYRDRTQVTVSLLSDCGYVTKSDTRVQQKMLEIAEARRDCFCVFSTPTTENTVDNIIDWRNNIQAMDTYRGALYGSTVKAYDAINGKSNFMVPSSLYALKIMGENNQFVAAAGLNRGVLASSVVTPMGLSLYVNEVQGGRLYTDNQVNMTIKSPTGGYVIWGQRTLQKQASALDRINVARTIIYIETVMRDALRWFLFEVNDSYTRTQIALQLSSFLDTVVAANGIQSYNVKCDNENNPQAVIAKNQLNVDVTVVPSYVIEAIELSMNISNGIATVTVNGR